MIAVYEQLRKVACRKTGFSQAATVFLKKLGKLFQIREDKRKK